MKARRRLALHKHQQSPSNSHKERGDKAALAAAMMSAAPSPRVINAAPSLEKAEMYGIDDNRPVFSRAMALAGRMFIETIPQWLAIGAMLSLIFGGCCSNVFALESIIKVEPASGTFGTGSFASLMLRRIVVGMGGLIAPLMSNRDAFDFRSVPLRGRHWAPRAVRPEAPAVLPQAE